MKIYEIQFKDYSTSIVEGNTPKEAIINHFGDVYGKIMIKMMKSHKEINYTAPIIINTCTEFIDSVS